MSAGTRLRFARTLLRRHVTSSRLYAYGRRLLLLGQYAARTPDDPDFRYFRRLRPAASGLVVDIGANGGQSAIGFAVCCPGFRILSFEPNPALWPELDFVKRIVGTRFDYLPYGLSDTECEMDLHVPKVGELPVTTRASLSQATARRQAQLLAREASRPPGVDVVKARFRRFDDLGLLPEAVKIDVEGAELSVLRGMRRTLEGCHPLLMLEANEQSADCRNLLAELGYEFFEYDAAEGMVAPFTGRKRNWFAIPARA